jgi:hypothetical protein
MWIPDRVGDDGGGVGDDAGSKWRHALKTSSYPTPIGYLGER